VGSLNEGGAGFIAALPNAPKSFAFELVAPSDPKKAHLDHAQLDVPGHSPVDVGGSRAGAFVVHVTRLEKRRGGVVELTLEGSLAEGLGVKAEVTTFVRDIVTAKAMYAPDRFGDAGFLR
jgi:hypothetical protein